VIFHLFFFFRLIDEDALMHDRHDSSIKEEAIYSLFDVAIDFIAKHDYYFRLSDYEKWYNSTI